MFDLRATLGLTQHVPVRGGSRQQVQKWESGKATPHRNQLDKLVKLAGAAATVRAPLAISDREMLTVSKSATYSSITEKTIRKALKDGRLAYTVDTSTSSPQNRTWHFDSVGVTLTFARKLVGNLLSRINALRRAA